jgi:hypothetical protein
MYGMAGGGLTSEFTSAGSMPYIVVSSQSPSHSNILIPRAAHAKERRPLRTSWLGPRYCVWLQLAFYDSIGQKNARHAGSIAR